MMMLLGQHGQPQDYQMGLEHIHLAAESCDENAPQGAYVRSDPYLVTLNFRNLTILTYRFTACSWHES